MLAKTVIEKIFPFTVVCEEKNFPFTLFLTVFYYKSLNLELFTISHPKRAPYYPWSRMRVGSLGFGCPVFFMNLAQICEILKKSMKKDLHTRLEMDPKI